MYGGTIKMFIRQSENRSRCRFMSAPSHLAGCILTPEGWVRGRIAFVDTVVAIEGFPDAPASREECIVLPGFVDLHVHGGAGADTMDGGAEGLHFRYSIPTGRIKADGMIFNAYHAAALQETPEDE